MSHRGATGERQGSHRGATGGPQGSVGGATGGAPELRQVGRQTDDRQPQVSKSGASRVSYRGATGSSRGATGERHGATGMRQAAMGQH